MFIYIPKINFIIHIFLEILHFKESSILAHNLQTIWDWWWNINTMLVSILDYFQEKLITKFFKKSQKPYIGVTLVVFAQTWVKMSFPGKRSLSVLRYSNYLPSCQKLEKNYWTTSEKNTELTDGQMGRQTSDFIGPSIGWGSNNF